MLDPWPGPGAGAGGRSVVGVVVIGSSTLPGLDATGPVAPYGYDGAPAPLFASCSADGLTVGSDHQLIDETADCTLASRSDGSGA